VAALKQLGVTPAKKAMLFDTGCVTCDTPDFKVQGVHSPAVPAVRESRQGEGKYGAAACLVFCPWPQACCAHMHMHGKTC
jgi:hypothetical protein